MLENLSDTLAPNLPVFFIFKKSYRHYFCKSPHYIDKRHQKTHLGMINSSNYLDK
ncbi:MAG: hypothetical protein ACI9UT_003371 [Flavobacteriales bacterium]|jgi:hypothetical protein